MHRVNTSRRRTALALPFFCFFGAGLAGLAGAGPPSAAAASASKFSLSSAPAARRRNKNVQNEVSIIKGRALECDAGALRCRLCPPVSARTVAWVRLRRESAEDIRAKGLFELLQRETATWKNERTQRML